MQIVSSLPTSASAPFPFLRRQPEVGKSPSGSPVTALMSVSVGTIVDKAMLLHMR